MRRFAAAIFALTVALQGVPVDAALQGTLSGTARDSSGQPLVNYTARLRDALSGRIVGETLSSQVGTFAFPGLNAASYVVEVVDRTGRVVGTSAVTKVASGSNAAVAVQAAGGLGGSAALNTGLLLTVLAASAGVAALVIGLNQEEASPSR
jgi:hypothetical protein